MQNILPEKKGTSAEDRLTQCCPFVLGSDERIQLFRIIERLPDVLGHIPKGGLESDIQIFLLHVRNVSHSSDENRLDPAGVFSIDRSVGLRVTLG